jgi:hypothetical protein
LLLAHDALLAQGATAGTLVGLITDPTAAAIPNVAVTAANIATNTTYRGLTNQTGNYTISALPAGVYRVSAESPGFKRKIYEKAEVNVNQTLRLDFAMEVGEVAVETTVMAQAPLINTDDAAVGQVIANKQIVDLPLNGRNFAQLARLVPGTVPGGRGFAGNHDLSGFDSPNFYAGGRNTNNSFLVDGIETKGEQFGNIVVVPNLDAINEFKVQINSYSAEFGSGNAVVNVATAGGTNEFHGRVYEFFRNDNLDARSFFDARRPEFRRNQFGGVFGGPIIRNRTFFMAGYEGLRQRNYNTVTASVPTALERAGNFTEYRRADGSLIPIIDVLAGAPFAGNLIPAARINPIGQRIANLYPLPNLPGTVLNFRFNPITPRTDDQFTIRGDHEFSANDRIFARYLWQRRETVLRGLPGFDQTRSDHPMNSVMGWTHILSPTRLNEFRLGFQRAVFIGFQNNEGKVGRLGGLEIPGPNPAPEFDAFPFLSITGKSAIGDTPNHFQRYENTYSLSDTFTWIHGTHSTRFGYYTRVKHENAVLREVWLRGGFFFAASFGGPQIASGMPDLLTGNPTIAIRSVGTFGNSRADGRATDQFLFIQDDWKLTPRLTLNLGLRYEYYQPWVDDAGDSVGTFTTGVGDKKGSFPNGMLVQANTPEAEAAGFTGRAKRALYFPDRNNFGPRVGLAWRPLGNNDTVLRIGYGIFYNQVIYDAAYFPNISPPVFGLQQVVGLLNINNPFPAFSGDLRSLNGYGFASDYVNGDVQQWNVTVQRRLPGGAAFEIGYVGNKGTHLDGGTRLVNQARPGTVGTLASRRPHPAFGVYETWDSSVSSHYQSLQTKVEKRFSNGLFFLAGYTWSKSIDTGAGAGDTFAGGDVVYWQNANAADERGLSLFDVRHRFILSWLYDLPFGKGKSFLNTGGPVNLILGGWQFSGIVNYQSGFPLTVRTGAARSGADPGSLTPTDRPNRIKDGNLPSGERTHLRWFDTTAFVLNPPGEFGNSGRGIITSPGNKGWDLALHKDFALREKHRLQFRFEAFNALNHVNFNFPDVTAASGTFGRIAGAGSGRQLQLALKYMF